MIFKKSGYRRDKEKAISLKIFIVPIVFFLICVPYMAERKPLLAFIAFFSFGITIILVSIYPVYASLKTDSYVQKHDFQLWKKSKSASFKDRREAGKAIKAMDMQVPCLAKRMKLAHRIAFILLTTWSLVFLCILLFVLISPTL